MGLLVIFRDIFPSAVASFIVKGLFRRDFPGETERKRRHETEILMEDTTYERIGFFPMIVEFLSLSYLLSVTIGTSGHFFKQIRGP